MAGGVQLSRLCSVGAEEEETPLQRLQTATEAGDLEEAFNLLEEHQGLGEERHLNALLELVCIKADSTAQQAAILLQHQSSRWADPNVVFSPRGCSPLHLVCSRGRADLIAVLLKNDARTKTLTQHGETPLHCLILGLIDRTVSGEEKAIECARLLFELDLLRGLDGDELDNRGRPAIYLAAKYGHLKLVEYLMTAQGANIDIPYRNETPRSLLRTTNMVEMVKKYPKKPIPDQDFKKKYFELISTGKEDKFIYLLENNRNIEVSNGNMTLLQACVSHGLSNAVKKLIEMNADVNATGGDVRSPIILATDEGSEEIIRLLLQQTSTDLGVYDNESAKRTVLHIAVLSKRCNSRCLELLLKRLSELKLNVINAQDFRNNTALHYAAANNKLDQIVVLLEHNANIFILNNNNSPAFIDINPKYLNDYLDARFNAEGGLSKDTDYDMIFDFSFMASTGDTDMGPLMMLANSPYHKELLKHPLIRSFLHLKWHRVSWIFYINFITYFLFTVALSVHIYNYIPLASNLTTNFTMEEDREILDDVLVEGTRWLTLGLLIVLFFFKITHLSIQMFRYFAGYLLEISLFIVTACLLLIPTSFYIHQLLCAVAVLLAYSEFMLLLSCHPSHATKIAMFFTVSKSFLFLLLWCSSLIIAFAFTFFIIFRRCEPNCEDQFFDELGTSFVRTVVMMAGEFNIGDMHFGFFSVISHIIFVLFLFFIATVLMSLLNGLAVSDTQAIKEAAQVVCCEAQARLYSEFETRWSGSGIFRGMVSRILRLPGLVEGRLHVQRDRGSKGACCGEFEELVREARAVVTQHRQGEGSVMCRLSQRLDRLENLLEKVVHHMETKESTK